MYLKFRAFKKYVAEIQLPGNGSSFIYNCFAAAGPIWSRIHEWTISFVYITKQFQTTFAEGGEGGKIC